MEKVLKSDKNIYGFVLVGKSPTVIGMDDFTFKIDEKTLHLSTEDEFLQSFVTNVNMANCKDISSLFNEIVKQYEVLMGLADEEKSPIYKEGQQVFELENDNHDMKFVSRMRLNPDDFNMDLLLNVFEFLPPGNTWKLSRVSKLWYKLTANDSLWKSYCKLEGFEFVEYKGKQSYFKEYLKSMQLEFVPKYSAKCIQFDESNTKIMFSGNMGKVVMTPSWHCTIKFEKPMLGMLQGCMFGFMTRSEFSSLNMNNWTYEFGYIWYHGGLLYGNVSFNITEMRTQYGTPSSSVMWGQNHYYGNIDDVVGVYYDHSKKAIGYHVNGVDQGIAFRNVVSSDLVPIVSYSGAIALRIVDTPEKFRFVNPKKQNKLL